MWVHGVQISKQNYEAEVVTRSVIPEYSFRGKK